MSTHETTSTPRTELSKLAKEVLEEVDRLAPHVRGVLILLTDDGVPEMASLCDIGETLKVLAFMAKHLAKDHGRTDELLAYMVDAEADTCS